MLPVIHQFGQDIRFAARMLRAHPAFALTATATLAAGIAAATLFFSVFNGLFLDSLPYPESARLVFLHEADREREDLKIAWQGFTAWRAGNQSSSHLAIYRENSGSLGGAGGAVRIKGATVSYEARGHAGN
jgi:hypothetical protein